MARFTSTIFFLSSPKGGLWWLRSQQDVSICLLIMARDEEALLRRHLPSWLPLLENGGCLVGQVDDRSSDGSHRAMLGSTAALERPLGAPCSERHERSH